MRKRDRKRQRKALVKEKIKMLILEQTMLDWKNQQSALEEQVKDNLEFRQGGYVTKYVAEFMDFLIQALAFWNFFKGRSRYFTSKQRMEFLSKIDPGNNKVFALVLKIEMLPVAVFRKILWKHNIDFMSLESFLRRLTGAQIDAIEQNYADLFQSATVPRVYGKIERFFKRLTVEKLMAADEDYNLRYSRKASWSYNLLSLDFGFNAYPKGILDDTKVEEISPLRFLSIKNHADDFVVNQENGKYWWLYKNARSNYIYKPNRRIQLSTHICPGFWWTFFAHLFFWVLSPLLYVAFTYAVPQFVHTQTLPGFLHVAVTGLPGLFTPVWCILAVIKFAVDNMTKLLSEKTGARTKKVTDFIGKCILVIVAITIVAVMITGVTAVAWYLYKFLFPAFGTLGSAGVIVGILYWIGIQIKEDWDVSWKWRAYEENVMYWLPMLIFVCGVVAKFILVYGSRFFPWLFYLAIRIAQALWDFLILYWIELTIIIMPLAIIAGVYYASEKWERQRQEAFFALTDKLIFCVFMPALVIATIIVGLYVESYSMVVGMISAIMLLGFSLYIINILTPEIYDVRKLAYKVNACEPAGNKMDYRLLLKNRWFCSLAEEEKLDVMRWLSSLVQNAFPEGERQEGFKLLLPKMNGDFYAVLSANIWDYLDCCDKVFCKFFMQEFIAGKSVEDSKALARQKREQYYAQQVVLKNRLDAFTKPFRISWNAVCAFFAKIAEIVVTFKRLYELFNKRCPYVTQPGTVKSNMDVY